MRNLLSWISVFCLSLIAQVKTFVLCGLACGYAFGVHAYLDLLQLELAPDELVFETGLDERPTGVYLDQWQPAVEAATSYDWQAVLESMPIIGFHFMFGFAVGAVVFVLIVNVATIYHFFRLRNNAIHIVGDVGAAEMIPADTPEGLMALHRIVPELSRAFNVPTPLLYWLPKEEGMNAFVVGRRKNDSVLVVTKGLGQMNELQLRGIVAHELAHLSNGDMVHNLRLLALELGVNSVRYTAEFLLRKGWDFLFGEASNHRSAMAAINLGVLMLIFGLVIWPIGVVVSMAGALAMAYNNRRRELRADKLAASVLGSWEPISEALRRIMGHHHRSKISGVECRKLGHLMFSHASNASGGAFCTHPKMKKRISRADRSWDGTPIFENAEDIRFSEDELVDLKRVQRELSKLDAKTVEVFRSTDAASASVPCLLFWKAEDRTHRQDGAGFGTHATDRNAVAPEPRRRPSENVSRSWN